MKLRLRRGALATAAWLGLATAIALPSAASTMTAIDDPTSTLSIVGERYAEPTHMIEIPVVLDTSRQVNYLTCRFGWDPARLLHLSVERGPGLPETAGTFDVVSYAGAEIGFVFDTGVEDPIDVAAEDPVAVLRFFVLCSEAYPATSVDFVGGTDSNYFNDEVGTSRGPNLVGDVVGMGLNIAAFRQSITDTWPNQLVEHSIELYNAWPGGPSVVELSYDDARLTLESVAAGPLVPAEDLVVDDSTPGHLVVQFVDVTIPEDVYAEILHLQFRTDQSMLDYATAITLESATEVVDGCGVPVAQLALNSGSVSVPAHTATVQLMDVNVYTTTTQYDVPFRFDSTLPVDNYNFRVSFDGGLTYVAPAVIINPFLPPDVTSNASELTILAVDDAVPPGEHLYVPDELPADVFKLRFDAPTPAPAVDDVFLLEFFDTTDVTTSNVIYESAPGIQLRADVTYLGGQIRVVRRPPPTCPTLYVWNGERYLRENTLLAACASRGGEALVTDSYKLEARPRVENGIVRMQVREDDVATSRFHDFVLKAVDHPEDTAIQVSPSGEIVALGNNYQLEWALDHLGRDVTALVGSRDDVAYESETPGWIEASYGTPRSDVKVEMLAASADRPPKDDRISKSTDAAPKVGAVEIAIRTADGRWQPLGESHPRYAPGRDAVLVRGGQVPAGRELVLRYRWQGSYRVDRLELQIAQQLPEAPRTLSVSGLRHNNEGAVINRLGREQDPIWLRPGERLELEFDASSLQTLEDGMVRDYVLVATGSYDRPASEALPAAVALGENAPNPFNPSTTIEFSLPRESQVSLRVIDVRGRVVRTLVSEMRAPGSHAVTWDGLTDVRTPAPSGVYFYQLDTEDFRQTRKMLLLK